MKWAIGIVLLWLLIYNDAELFKVLHGFVVGLLK